MIMTRKKLKDLCDSMRWRISPELESKILLEYGEEPTPYEWSEQDLFEQIRKLVVCEHEQLEQRKMM